MWNAWKFETHVHSHLIHTLTSHTQRCVKIALTVGIHSFFSGTHTGTVYIISLSSIPKIKLLEFIVNHRWLKSIKCEKLHWFWNHKRPIIWIQWRFSGFFLFSRKYQSFNAILMFCYYLQCWYTEMAKSKNHTNHNQSKLNHGTPTEPWMWTKFTIWETSNDLISFAFVRI